MTHTDPNSIRRSLEISANATGLATLAPNIEDLDEAHTVLAALAEAENSLAKAYGQLSQWFIRAADSDEISADKLNTAADALQQASVHAAGAHERVQTARGHASDLLFRSPAHN
ncbi:hypothetical protein ACFSBZ_16985 [Amnibacterium flavum]|uniref:hypothetical protein n=1 Tax=Amnibacterium flavum TaxID=2173173 RepID=UPI0014033980|nr:hypothetical protein [Amnibacterium flavum]